MKLNEKGYKNIFSVSGEKQKWECGSQLIPAAWGIT
jgi:hypothetical protein